MKTIYMKAPSMGCFAIHIPGKLRLGDYNTIVIWENNFTTKAYIYKVGLNVFFQFSNDSTWTCPVSKLKEVSSYADNCWKVTPRKASAS